MRAERPGVMVVLAVDVGGDQAADGDEAGTRHHGRKPAARHERAQDVVEQDARLARQQAGLAVERQDPVVPQHGDRQVGVDRGVAVRPPVAAGDQRRGAVEQAGQIARAAELLELAVHHGIPAPPGKLHAGRSARFTMRP